MVAAIGLSLVLAAVIFGSALQSSNDAHSSWARWAVVAGGLAAAGLCVAVIWECLVPGSPIAEGILAGPKDQLELGAAQGGVIKLLAEPLPGVETEGTSVIANVMVVSESGTQRQRFEFRLGDKTPKADDTAPALDQRTANLILEATDVSAVARLERLEPKGIATLKVSYYGRSVPFRLAAIVLTLLAALAALYEAVVPSTHRRSFLTVSWSAAATLVWMVLDGVTGESPFMVLLGRLVWASVAGMVIGTLGPLLVRKLLPRSKRSDDSLASASDSAASEG